MQNQDLYAQLELIPPQSNSLTTTQPAFKASSQTDFSARLQQWGKTVLAYVVGSKAPRITTKTNRAGQLVYEIYDPVDHRHHYFGSESEVRIWLEGRYYQ